MCKAGGIAQRRRRHVAEHADILVAHHQPAQHLHTAQHHGMIDPSDQACALGDADKIVGGQNLVLVVAQPRHRLVVAHLALRQRHHRLQIDIEPVLLDRIPDGADELRRSGFFIEIPGSSGAQQINGVLVFSVCREHENGQLRFDMLQRLERIDAVLVGHRDVEQHHVEVARAHRGDGFGAARGFGCHLHVDLVSDELLQAGTDDGMVVGDQYPDHDSPLGPRRGS